MCVWMYSFALHTGHFCCLDIINYSLEDYFLTTDTLVIFFIYSVTVLYIPPMDEMLLDTFWPVSPTTQTGNSAASQQWGNQCIFFQSRCGHLSFSAQAASAATCGTGLN